MLNPIQIDQYCVRLENAIREAMLQGVERKALIVVEGLYALKLKPDTWMPFKQIYRLLRDNFGCSRRLVYEGLQTKLVFQRRKDTTRANKRGAPPYLYCIPHPLQLKAEFAPESELTPSDQLVKTDLKSVSSYRTGVHREFMIRRWKDNGYKGVKIHREAQAHRLGVTARTVRGYDHQLGFSHEANYDMKRIFWQDWDKLPRYKNNYDAQGKKQPSRKWLKVINTETWEEQNLPYVAYLAYAGLKANCAVYEVSRDANTYYPYKRPQRIKNQGLDALDYYYAELEAIQEAGFYRQDNEWIRLRV